VAFLETTGSHRTKTREVFVEIRKRMGEQVFNVFEQSIINAVSEEQATTTDDDSDDSGSGHSMEEKESTEDVSHKGKLILDATVAEQAIRFPTDLDSYSIYGATSNILKRCSIAWRARLFRYHTNA